MNQKKDGAIKLPSWHCPVRGRTWNKPKRTHQQRLIMGGPFSH